MTWLSLVKSLGNKVSYIVGEHQWETQVCQGT